MLLILSLVLVQSVRGTVRSAESHEPLGLTIVALHPGFPEQFTDAAGTFAFVATKPGRYLLSVRQIGYAPIDTQLVVAGDSVTTLQIGLHHLAIELPVLTIADSQCGNPGPPHDAAVRVVLEQLRENARRFQLLAQQYPFTYELELSDRSVTQHGDTGRPARKWLRFSSADYHPYTVGNVVEPGWGPWGSDQLVIHTAELQDFNNPSFIDNHCFRLTGLDTIGGQRFVRIAFEPATHIWSPDFTGAAYLDSASYELRYTETSLTHPERSALDGVRAESIRTHFTNIAPGVPLQDSLTATETYRSRGGAKLQTQRTLHVRFTRRSPPQPLAPSP